MRFNQTNGQPPISRTFLELKTNLNAITIGSVSVLPEFRRFFSNEMPCHLHDLRRHGRSNFVEENFIIIEIAGNLAFAQFHLLKLEQS